MDYDEKAKEFAGLMTGMKGSARHEMMQKMSRGECFMLGHLQKNGGSVMAGELAKCTGVSTARITAMLKEAEKKGFIQRRMVEGDRRKTMVVLTDEGHKRIHSFYEETMKHMAQYLEALGPEDTEHLLRIMRKSAEILAGQE